jgi:hypothetical protein
MQGRGPNIPSSALLSLLLVEDPLLVEMEDLPPLLVDGFLQQVLEQWQHVELTSRSPPSLLTICSSSEKGGGLQPPQPSSLIRRPLEPGGTVTMSPNKCMCEQA